MSFQTDIGLMDVDGKDVGEALKPIFGTGWIAEKGEDEVFLKVTEIANEKGWTGKKRDSAFWKSSLFLANVITSQTLNNIKTEMDKMQGKEEVPNDTGE